MAHLFPARVDDYHNSWGEKEIFDALKQLSDEWYILYSLNWKNRNDNGRIIWGEADFVIIHKTYGIMVIEVKSGGIQFKNGEWIQTRMDNGQKVKMKNPFTQVNRNKYGIIDAIENALPYHEQCFVDKAVWFPSINDVSDVSLPLEYDKNIVLTSEALQNPVQYIIRAFNYYNSKKQTMLSDDGMKIILDTLMPEFNLIPSASNVKKELDYSFLQLTNEQKKVLDFIDIDNNVLIQGAAGTGKTLIATEEARRISRCYGKTLFLCYNRYLYKHLENNCPYLDVDYYNLHSFLSLYSEEDLFNNEKLINAIKEVDLEKIGYKYIIIDEAQDFSDGVLETILEKCNSAQIKCSVYYDKNQVIFGDHLPPIFNDFDCKLTLNMNCRNTLKILSTTNSPLNIPIKHSERCVAGVMPKLFYSDNLGNLLKSIEYNIDKYLEIGYKQGDIVILTLLSEESSIIKNNFIGKYKIKNNPISREKDSIVFTSVKKYKGLESDIVIIVDFDKKYVVSEELKRLLYVAMSRARQRLDIFYLAIDNDMEKLGNILNSDINPYTAISTGLKVILKKIK